MDNLETLFNKKEYQLVLDLTRGSVDPKECLLRVSCLVILGKSDEALDEIEKHQSIIEKKHQLRLMKMHFELLLSKKLFDEARIALKHYENLSYVSQEVEEFMREMKERIEEESHPKNSKRFELDEIYDVLEKETDTAKISQVLFSLKDYNINIYIDSLLIFIKRNDVHPNFRTYGLMLLIDAKYDHEVEFISLDGLVKINPCKITPPFMSKNFNETCRLITEKADNNVTLSETALHLFNCYIIDTYPRDIYKEDIDKLASAFIIIGTTYLGQEVSSLDEDTKILSDKIKTIIESTPEFRL